MSEIWNLKGHTTVAHALNVGPLSSSMAGWGSGHSWGNNGPTQRPWQQPRTDDGAIGGGQAGAANLGSIVKAVVRRNENIWSLQAQKIFERVLGRLKVLGRFVVRYEKLAIHSLTAIHFASLVYCWF